MGIFFYVRPAVAKAYVVFVATCVPNTKTKLILDAVGFAEGFGAQAIGFDVVDELHLVGVQFDLAVEEQGHVGGVTSDVSARGRFWIPLGLAARLDAIEKIADVESRWIAIHFFHGATGQQLRRTEDHFAAVSRFDPTGLPFETHWAGTEWYSSRRKADC